MRKRAGYRAAAMLEFLPSPETLYLEDWRLWQFHHALVIARKIMTVGRAQE